MKRQMKRYGIVFWVTAVWAALAACAPGPAGVAQVEPPAEAVMAPASVAPAAGDAFYTERYWEMATNLSAEAAAGDAYYTERYWKLASESATAGGPAAEAAGDAFYTEKYWKLAGQHAAAEEETFAYYTERYWNMSK